MGHTGGVALWSGAQETRGWKTTWKHGTSYAGQGLKLGVAVGMEKRGRGRAARPGQGTEAQASPGRGTQMAPCASSLLSSKH